MPNLGNTSKGPLPLIIGVIGHQDLREKDYESLKARIHEIFHELDIIYPHTPVIVLSALTEGAERLVARVALDLEHSLIAVLPMGQDFYEMDHSSPESRAELTELHRRAIKCIPLESEFSDAEIQQPGEPRNQQLAKAMAYIVRHCQLLIAIWDGVDTGVTGSIAQGVRFNLEGIPHQYAPLLSSLDPVESCPVYHILTPTLRNPEPEGQALTLYKQFPETYETEKAAETVYKNLYHRINSLNKDALRLRNQPAVQMTSRQFQILPKEVMATLPPSLKESLNKLLDYYELVDVLAIDFQKKTLWSFYGLLVTGILAAVFFAIYAHILPEMSCFLDLNLFCLVLAYGVYYCAKFYDYENKYFDYRALAEGLRVQLFWKFAGIQDSVADHYLRKQRSELDWVRNAIRNWWLLSIENCSHAEISAQANLDRSSSLVLKYWIQDQKTYFVKASKQNSDRAKFLEKGIQWLIPMSVVLTVALAFVFIPDPWLTSIRGLTNIREGLTSIRKWIHEGNGHGLAIVVIAFPTIVAAIFSWIADKRALSDHAKQYKRMDILFEKANTQLGDHIEQKNYSEAQKLIKSVGEEALAENGDWVLLHRERPLDVFKE